MLYKLNLLVHLVCILTVLPHLSAANMTNVQMVGGHEPKAMEYLKYIVVIKYSYSSMFLCNGVLIGSNRVLTAAHCLKSKMSKDLIVVSGIKNEEDIFSFKKDFRRFKINNFWIHPNFERDNDGYDIAIALLKVKAHTQQERLPSIGLMESQPNKLSHCWTYGWGANRITRNPRKSQLQEANVMIIDEKFCLNKFRRKLINELCVGADGYMAGSLDCGNPLICDGALAGIQSNSYQHNTTADIAYQGSIYTSTYDLSDWLNKMLYSNSAAAEFVKFISLILMCFMQYLNLLL